MILVTGGAGFIGGNYLWHLYKTGKEKKVVCVDKLTYAANLPYIQPLIDNGFVEFVQADIADGVEMLNCFEKYGITKVVNFAAESHVDNSILDVTPFVHTNIIGTINLLKIASIWNPLEKFIHISTDEVYGALQLEDTDSFNEETLYKPNNPYSASKASSDHFVRAFRRTHGVPAIITNCSNNYGPNQNAEKFIPTIIRKALANEKIPVYGDGMYVRDWLYVEDHCRGIQLALENGMIGEKYNIGGGTELPNIEVVSIILEKLGKPKSLIEYIKDRPGHDRRYSIDCTKISKELGYAPAHTFEQGLELTLKEYLK